MDSDFKSWYLENSDLFVKLHNSDSVLFYHVKDIIDTLAYIAEKEDVSSEYLDIFDTGYAYLYSYISSLKTYLENYFSGDINALLKYEHFLRYNFYLNDIKDILIEENIYDGDLRKDIEYILEDIEDILQNKKEAKDEILDSYDTLMENVIPKDKYLQTIPEIFSDVIDTLEI